MSNDNGQAILNEYVGEMVRDLKTEFRETRRDFNSRFDTLEKKIDANYVTKDRLSVTEGSVDRLGNRLKKIEGDKTWAVRTILSPILGGLALAVAAITYFLNK